jgi:hypothetical protein
LAESPDIKLRDFTELEFKFWLDTVEDFWLRQKSRTLN